MPLPRSCAVCKSVHQPGERCPVVQARRQRYDQAKPSSTARGYGSQWQRVRLKVLDRDGWRCRWCGGWANTVDHVRPKVHGGSDEMANLVACCATCNSSKAHRAAPRRRAG